MQKFGPNILNLEFHRQPCVDTTKSNSGENIFYLGYLKNKHFKCGSTKPNMLLTTFFSVCFMFFYVYHIFYFKKINNKN